MRWLRACTLVAYTLQRVAALFTRRVWSAGWLSVCGLPPVRQQLLDPAVHVRGQSRQHIFEVGPRLVPIELGRLCRSPNYAEYFWKDAFPVAFTTREWGSIQICSA